MDFHKHNQVEIMYVIKGKCAVETEGCNITMKNGDFILIDANVPHRLVVGKDKPCRMLNIEFIFVEAKSIIPCFAQTVESCKAINKLVGRKMPYIVLKDSNEVYPILKAIINELGEVREDKSLMLDALMLQLLEAIARMAVEMAEKGIEVSDVYIRKAIQYMQHNYDCEVNVSDVAKTVNVHPAYLHRIFKAKTGLTINAYLTQLRMNKAKMLLANTDIPIIDVSNYVGINSRQYFSYVFKKNTGLTPAQYRKSAEKFVDM
ncbi:MAG: AraC family transcriptional regulator [Clostridia bacterium]|nr:AraC family transcriptional regulator [Clostridia bacterium]